MKKEKINNEAENKSFDEISVDKKAEKRAKKANKKTGGAAFLVLKIVIALTLVLVIFYFGFTCTVREGSSAIITRFGKPRETVTEAGLHLKLPWPFENVITYDSREQYYETRKLETLTMDSKNIAFQSYVVWKIHDPLKYHVATTKKDSATDINEAIETSVRNAINTVMGKYNLSDLVSSSNENLKIKEIQQKIYEKVKDSCYKTYSIDIIDVSILRLSYPDANLPNILTNISAERQGVIDTILANANAEASKITSSADAEAAQIVANGEIEASKIRAEAEKEVAAIYAEAQEANIELFKFLKELDTIVNSVNSNSVLVVDSNAYPFNILLNYGQTVDENTSVITELEYVFSQLSEADRTALTEAIHTLLATQGNQGSQESSTESGSETLTDTSVSETTESSEISSDTQVATDETSESDLDTDVVSETTSETVTDTVNSEEPDSNVDENGGV